MIVVICAAGEGKRLASLNLNYPKILMKVGKKSLIERQLDNITANTNVSKIIIVVGYKKEIIKKALGNSYNGVPLIYVFNDFWQTKGNMSSLFAARDYITEDFAFTVGDLIINKENVRRILQSEHEASLLLDISEEAKNRDDPLKAVMKNGRLVRLEKRLPVNIVYGASGGYYKFKLKAAKKFYEIMRKHFEKGEVDLPWNIPVEELAKVQKIVPVHADGSFCNDIDVPEDIAEAKIGLKQLEKN